MINREYMTKIKANINIYPVFALEQLLSKNKDIDNWFLQIGYFDPHEPFHAPKRFKELFPTI